MEQYIYFPEEVKKNWGLLGIEKICHVVGTLCMR